MALNKSFCFYDKDGSSRERRKNKAFLFFWFFLQRNVLYEKVRFLIRLQDNETFSKSERKTRERQKMEHFLLF